MLELIGRSKVISSIAESRYFEKSFYENQCGVGFGSEADAINHYLSSGWKKGFATSPFFDLVKYSLTNKISVFTEAPLKTFLQKGALKGFEFPKSSEFKFLVELEALSTFSEEAYLYFNADIKDSGINAKLHFARHGWQEGRRFTFDDFLYHSYTLGENKPNVLDEFSRISDLQNKYEEYLDFRELSSKYSTFDSNYYIQQYKDINDGGLSPLEHYYLYGFGEKRFPVNDSRVKAIVNTEQFNNVFDLHVEISNCTKVVEQVNTKQEFPAIDRKSIKQIDVLIAVKNYHLASALWRAQFFCESLKLNGIKAVIRSENELEELLPSARILVLQKFTSLDDKLKNLLKKAKENGVSLWGDIDDNFHPNYIKYSGQALSGMWDSTQQKKISNGFNDVLGQMDVILVSSPKLKKVYSVEFPSKTVLIRKNVLPERFFSKKSLSLVSGSSLKLVYPSGSKSHSKDFEPIADQLFDFLRRFKDCTLTLIGGDSVEVPEKLLKRSNVILKPRMSFDEMLSEIEQHDLLLAPLLKNSFNDAKSNIKFIEAAAVKVPTITTSVTEFGREIKDGKNGFIEDDFSRWGERLIEFRRNPNVLIENGEEAYKHVLNTLTTDYLEKGIREEVYSKVCIDLDTRFPNKSHQKYPNWLIKDNEYVPTVSSAELTNRVNDYCVKKQKRGKAKFAVYTCLSNNYDSLKLPEFLDDDIDYICFSDVPVWGYGVWEVRPYAEAISHPVRQSRHPKIMPHKYLGDYDASIYVDANLLIAGSLRKVFQQQNDSGAHIAGIKHPWRNCIYKEANTCLEGGKDNKGNIEKTIAYLRKNNFPDEYGLFENNFIYRKHNETDVIRAMEYWWFMYMNYSSRDQLSYMYSLFKAGVKPHFIYNNINKNVRNTTEFLYFSHGEDDLWMLKV